MRTLLQQMEDACSMGWEDTVGMRVTATYSRSSRRITRMRVIRYLRSESNPGLHWLVVEDHSFGSSCWAIETLTSEGTVTFERN